MIIIELKLNYEMGGKQEIVLLETITKVVSYEIRRPISNIMCFLERSKGVMDTSIDPLVLVSITCLRKIEIETKEDICHALLKVLQIVIPVVPERICINFMPIEASGTWQFYEGSPICPLTKREGEKDRIVH